VNFLPAFSTIRLFNSLIVGSFFIISALVLLVGIFLGMPDLLWCFRESNLKQYNTALLFWSLAIFAAIIGELLIVVADEILIKVFDGLTFDELIKHLENCSDLVTCARDIRIEKISPNLDKYLTLNVFLQLEDESSYLLKRSEVSYQKSLLFGGVCISEVLVVYIAVFGVLVLKILQSLNDINVLRLKSYVLLTLISLVSPFTIGVLNIIMTNIKLFVALIRDILIWSLKWPYSSIKNLIFSFIALMIPWIVCILISKSALLQEKIILELFLISFILFVIPFISMEFSKRYRKEANFYLYLLYLKNKAPRGGGGKG